ncbi:MAG: Rieske (2Fe-2S) protein [Pseudomonadota bacterium]
MAGAAAIGAFAGLTASEADASKPPEKMPVQPGDRIQFIKGPNKGSFLQPDMLVEGEKPIEAFPFDPAADVLRRKYRLNRLLVLKLNPGEMNADTKARSLDGLLVFSALCTHRACTIKSWMPEERNLRCHCHLSRFAALEEGRVLDGPAKRQLPMVPIALDEEGFVVATATFTSRPGGAKK